jgi:hypothetical protein
VPCSRRTSSRLNQFQRRLGHRDGTAGAGEQETKAGEGQPPDGDMVRSHAIPPLGTGPSLNESALAEWFLLKSLGSYRKTS